MDGCHTLKKLSGQTHQVYTGVCLLFRRKTGETPVRQVFADCTDVTFYPVSDEKILHYVSTGEPMDKAGSYGIQGRWGCYVKEIRGNYHNVVGLPVSRLLYEAEQAGLCLEGDWKR